MARDPERELIFRTEANDRGAAGRRMEITVDALEDGLVYIDVIDGSVRASICFLPEEAQELIEKLKKATSYPTAEKKGV